ncbi:type-1B angiotensin II receptor [Biomphalaria pfeifferi]|uniref:Type-1B angiotensin II receptor n=1 Tax=Biomphalaria pfeifferi TaxID=112525 RepID=A0AAD8BEX0_BIOPF|nr:type-1B angiotensin II receptor [Biomphalaria pfeifferi]
MEYSPNSSWGYNNSTENIPKTGSDVLTFHQFVMFEGILNAARAVISLLGIFGNTINIMTYISMGNKDGFSLSMTLLSGIELVHVIAIFMRSVAYGLFIVEYSTQFITWFPMHVCLETITIQEHVHRFKVNLCHFSCDDYFIPLLMTMSMELQYDARINSTRVIFWVTARREQVRTITWIARNATLPVSTQVVIVCCVLHMSQKLQRSLNFRLYPQGFSQSKKATVLTRQMNSDMKTPKLASDKTKANVLTGKERRVIQQMVVMCIVVIVCDLPEILISLASVLKPTFGFHKSLNNIYLAVIGVNHVFQVVNTSINIIIYWNYSSRYRHNCCLSKLYVLDTRH